MLEYLFTYYLRAPDRKYQKSHDRSEISDFILFHLNVPFGELFSKITIKSSFVNYFQKSQLKVPSLFRFSKN